MNVVNGAVLGIILGLSVHTAAIAAPVASGDGSGTFDSSGISANPTSTTYSDVKIFLKTLADKYPQNAKLFNLGASDSGDMIQGVALGNGPIHNLVVATHHGNEYGSVEVARAFAQALSENPIAGQTVYVIPVLNIGGYNQKNRREPANGRTYDPNRNYPGPCGTEGPFTLKSTKALAEFLDREHIVASATLHTFYPTVVYPWGISTHDLSTPYDDQFKQLCEAATIESHYQIGNSTAVMYPVDGAFEDYAYWKHGIWSLLFELGETHSPSVKQIQQMVQVNLPGLRRFLEQAPRTRAENHGFAGKCDRSKEMLMRDLHDE